VMNIQRINARTLELLLGRLRFWKYRARLMEETGLTLDDVTSGEFLVSRAENFAGGVFTDLGSANVVFYRNDHQPGHCIVVHDR
jgi:hypothetical protein